MRVAAIVILIYVAATPSRASDTCMSQSEARQHFGSVHLYWHGADHCWDATAGRHHQLHRTAHKGDHPILGKDGQPAKPQESNSQDSTVRDKWQDSMSKMLADDEALPTVKAQTQSQPRSNDGSTAAAPSLWEDRWVDIVQVVPPVLARGASEPPTASASTVTVGSSALAAQVTEPTGMPNSFVLIFFTMILSLAVIEVLFRSSRKQ